MEFSNTIELFKRDPILVEHFVDAIIALDDNQHIMFWNYGASLLFKLDNKQVLGKSLGSIIKLVSDGFTLEAKNSSSRGEVALMTESGRNVYCKYMTSPYGNEGQQTVIVLRDISQQKALESLVHSLKSELVQQSIKSTEELAQLYGQINEGFIAFDKDWNYTHVNEKASQMVGRHPKDLIGKNVWKEFPKAMETNFYPIYLEVMRTQQYRRIEEYSPQLDKWFEIDLFPSSKGLSVLFHDVTDFKRTSKLLSQREMLYRTIVETVQEGIWTFDERHKTTLVNNAVTKMLGYEKQEIIGRELFEFLDQTSVERAAMDFDSIVLDHTIHSEYILNTKSKSKITVSVNAIALRNEEKYIGALVTMMDVTERQNNEKELKASFQLLRELNGRLEHIREEERSTIARELHDELGQQLTALKMDAYWLAKNIHVLDAKTITKIERISQIAAGALDMVEKKAIELHPAVLHNLGLLAAINMQNSQFVERLHVPVDFHVLGSDDGLSPSLSLALYRIYQEALNNIARHSAATAVQSWFICRAEEVELSISDNGIGFDTQMLQVRRSFGILSMKERATMIGGNFAIDSAVGKGTVVSVTIPLTDIKK